jgi:1,4-dihydroxy-6-naphthoate synthase
MNDLLSLGFSPCPNDTFIFYALVHGKIAGDQGFADPVLDDVEQLNRWALQERLDVTKMSFHGYGHVRQHYRLLRCGGALGRGCGPLLIVRPGTTLAKLQSGRIAIPGRLTTAALLLKMFLPGVLNTVEMRFDQIIEAVLRGEVDGGVIIHESRFTYQQSGLSCLEDLGRWWEESHDLPLPLGCIVARRSLGEERFQAIEAAVAASVRYAAHHPREPLAYIRRHSQELAEEVVQNHISLYVNTFTEDYGEEGLRAIRTFFELAERVGALQPSRE